MLIPKELILRPKPVPISEFDLTQSCPSRIIACPNPPIEAVEAGCAIAISDSSFEVRQVLKQLPADFQPDLVHLSARVMSFQPRGLEKLNCPVVMKLGDTFHLGDGGLSQMVQYCRKLNCDYHWTYQSPQHLHFFAESGLNNVFWLPASIVLDPYIPPPSEKSYDVIFRGSKSELHCYRDRVLAWLPSLDVQTKTYIESLKDYTKAQIVMNTSLNGDLNRRVFEVLMAGGFLLTDRIRPQTGLFELFQEGIHLECYGSKSELIEKTQFYLAHPEQAAQIAATGHQKFWDHYSPQATQQKLYRYIFDHEIEPPFERQHDRRSHSFKLAPRIKLYELIQELHRLNTTLEILCWKVCPEIVSDLADLPRSQATYIVEPNLLSPFTPTDPQPSINSPSRLPTHSNFGIVVLDGTHPFKTLQQEIQDCVALLKPQGFLMIVQPRFTTIQRLNQYLEQHHCTPIQLSIELFQQNYQLALNQHGLIYQKILPEAEIKHIDSMKNLSVNHISSAKVIQQQIKNFAIVRFLRSIRALLHRHTPS
ncbi:MAG TPA: glycosyltransferase [Leptolyngbya sp.]|jgi:hypothetical protein|nr:glycosyltransferase [Leptolyngbya sp.]